MTENAEEFQRLDHRQRLLQTMLDMNLSNQRDMQREEQRLRSELMRLENEKYRKIDVLK